MAAVELRLCDEDLKELGGPEWIRFDERELDDLDFNTLNGFEAELGISLEFLFSVDMSARTARWTAARVWMGRKMAGIDTPPWEKFNIKVRKVQARRPVGPGAADADPPDSSPSSEAEVSETESA